MRCFALLPAIFVRFFSSSSFTGLSPLRPVPQFLWMKQRTRFIFFLSACDNWRKDVQMLPVPKKSPHWVTRKLWSRALRFSTRPEGMILKPCTITSPHCFLFFIVYVQRNHPKMQSRFMLCLWWAPTRVIFRKPLSYPSLYLCPALTVPAQLTQHITGSAALVWMAIFFQLEL